MIRHRKFSLIAVESGSLRSFLTFNVLGGAHFGEDLGTHHVLRLLLSHVKLPLVNASPLSIRRRARSDLTLSSLRIL